VFVSHNPGLYDPTFAYGICTKYALFLSNTSALALHASLPSRPDGIMRPVMEGQFGREWLEEEVAKDEQRTRAMPPVCFSLFLRFSSIFL
jgi:hypothetical protein